MSVILLIGHSSLKCGGEKVALLVLPKGWLCVSGQNQMCHLCGWLKLFLKKCGGKKNKKHRVGKSVGLLAVPFEYVRYVGDLSKWFVFVLLFKFRMVVVVGTVVLPLAITYIYPLLYFAYTTKFSGKSASL